MRSFRSGAEFDSLRFTPGRMTAAGLKAFRARDERKTIQYSYQLERAKFGPAQTAALRANPKAATFFAAQPPGYRKLMTWRVMSAKAGLSYQLSVVRRSEPTRTFRH